LSALTALDTSVAVPLLVRPHKAHGTVVRWWDGRAVALSGHALAETYSVLTRLPGDIRLAPEDAARLLAERFPPPLDLGRKVTVSLPQDLARLGIAGGAVYDAMIALAAVAAKCPLATRDGRAKNTYEAVGACVIVVG
jgi:predicted nucleic acid-binding protein